MSIIAKQLTIVVTLFNPREYLLGLFKFLEPIHSFVDIIFIDDSDNEKIIGETASQLASFENFHYQLFQTSSFAKKGVSFARNLGISHAKTPFISFLDQDDSISLPSLAEALEELRSNSSRADLFVFPYTTKYLKSNKLIYDELVISNIPKICSSTSYLKDEIYASSEKYRLANLVLASCWSKIYKMSVIKSYLIMEKKLKISAKQTKLKN